MAEPSQELREALSLYRSVGGIEPQLVMDRFRKHDVKDYQTLSDWLSHGHGGRLTHAENRRAVTVEHWFTEIDRDYRSARRLLKRLWKTEEEYGGIRVELLGLSGERASDIIDGVLEDYAREFAFDSVDLSDFILHKIYHMWELTGQLMWSFYKLGGKWKEARFPEIRTLILDMTLDDFFTYSGVVVGKENRAYVRGALQEMKELRNRVSHGSSGIGVTENMELSGEEEGVIVIWDHNTEKENRLEAFSSERWREYARMSYAHFIIGFNMLLSNMDVNLKRSDYKTEEDKSGWDSLDNATRERLDIERWLDSEEIRREVEMTGYSDDETTQDNIIGSYEMDTDDIEF